MANANIFMDSAIAEGTIRARVYFLSHCSCPPRGPTGTREIPTSVDKSLSYVMIARDLI